MQCIHLPLLINSLHTTLIWSFIGFEHAAGYRVVNTHHEHPTKTEAGFIITEIRTSDASLHLQ